MVVPDGLWEAVNKIQDTLLICPPAASQCAAARRAARRRRLPATATPRSSTRCATTIYEALSAPDVPCEVPAVAGAFYYLIRVRLARSIR